MAYNFAQFQTDFQTQIANARAGINTFDTNYASKVQTFTTAGQNANKAIDSLARGALLLQAGDERGGALAILQGVGDLSNLGALLGPFGSASGAVLSVITELLASIFGALGPQKESLEAMLERIISTQDLKNEDISLKTSKEKWAMYGEGNIDKMNNARQAVAKAMDAGLPFTKEDVTDAMYFPETYYPHNPDDKDHSYANIRAGLGWDTLEEVTRVVESVSDIDQALNLLSENPDVHSEWWGALMDQAVGYMYRVWISILNLETLVNVETRGAYLDFRDGQSGVAKTWKAKLDNLESIALTNCPLYSRWHSGNTDYLDTEREPIYYRVGMKSDCASSFSAVSALDNVRNFAVSSNGTIFETGEFATLDDLGNTTTYKTVAARRRGGSGAFAPTSPACEEVFIGEMPDYPDMTIVAGTYGDGYNLMVSSFNETPGLGEKVFDQWTPNETRWQGHFTWKHKFRIASVAIVPMGNKEYAMYLLGLNDDLTATLYQHNWNEGTATAIPGFSWTRDEIEKAGALSLMEDGNWQPYPSFSCEISLAPMAVQLGSLVRVRLPEKDKDGKDQFKDFDLRQLSLTNESEALTDLKTHRGKFYSDGTFVVCSNKGLHMGYWDSQKAEFESMWVYDDSVETEVVQKIPLINGGLYRAMQTGLAPLQPA